MKKRIIVTANCANDLSWGMPGAFTIVIGQALAGRIKELAKVVEDFSANAIETSNYAGTWSDACIDDWTLNQSNLTSKSLASAIEELESSVADIDGPKLHVTSDEFYFTARPRHAGDELLLTTLRIPLSELDSDKPCICMA